MWRAWVGFDDVLLVGERVVRPRKNVLRLRGAFRDVERCAYRERFGACCVARYPRHEHEVTFVDVPYLCASFFDDARCLVAENDRRLSWAMHLVKLRVTDTGGELTHDDLRRAGIGQYDFFDAQRCRFLRQYYDVRARTHFSDLPSQ